MHGRIGSVFLQERYYLRVAYQRFFFRHKVTQDHMHQHNTNLSCTGPSRKCEPGCFGGARASLKHISRSANPLRARWIYFKSMSKRYCSSWEDAGRDLMNVAFSILEPGPNTSPAWRRRNSGLLHGCLNGDWLCLSQKSSKRLWYFHARL